MGVKVKGASAAYQLAGDAVPAYDGVPEGYKCTEVGVIPQDWRIESLDAIARVTSGKRLPAGYALTEHETSHAYVRVVDMRPGTISLRDIKYVPPEAVLAIKQYRIFKEDLFISVAGTLGVVGKVPLELDGANLTENADRITDITCSQEYLLHVLLSPLIQTTVDSLRTVGAQPKLALERIRKFSIPLPSSVAEQHAIAEALSDTDTLIESLQQLIAKKRALKEGAMQARGAGQQRLGEFDEDWIDRPLGSFVKVEKGELITEASVNIGLIPVIAGGKRPAYFHAKANRHGKTITISASGANAGYVSFHREPIFASDCSTISEADNYSIEFMYFMLQFRQRDIYATQSGGAQPHVHPNDLRLMHVSVPNLNEQAAIATVLSDMDAEIDALEARIAKTRNLKAGMMQALLTGRVRLVQARESTRQSERVEIQPKKSGSHSKAFNEAIIISALAKRFGSERFPLGRKRYTKLSYLLHRHAEGRTEGYLKKAAGPYNPKTRYGGSERLALEKGYIRECRSGPYVGFVAAKHIDAAESYFEKWYGADCIAWLEQFRRRKNDELELLATVDMAIEELRRSGSEVSLWSVKTLVRNHKEWRPKLDRSAFSDANIAKAIDECTTLFAPEKRIS